MNDDAVERAVERCYDAVVAPEQWGDALHGLARSLDAACMMFYPRNPDPTSADGRNPDKPFLAMPASRDFGDLLDEYVRGNWFLHHYRAERGGPMIDRGKRVVLEHDIATDDERRKSRLYNELYLQFGFPGFAVVGVDVAGSPWGLPLLKGQGQGHFDRTDAARLERLAPHFRRLIHLSEAFDRSRLVAGMDAIDMIGRGAALLDWRGKVIRLNRHAEQLIGQQLLLRAGMLVAAEADQDLNLQAFIRAAIRREALPGPVLVGTSRGSRLHVDLMPVSGNAADLFPRSTTVLVFTTLGRGPMPPERVLRRLFGLTPGEARLAVRLATGEDLAEAASALGIARETARSVLKQIFEKTETHRQVELVLLLARATNFTG
ncbi:MAG TPA: helix-turn-helix transcriptional regulator [Kaistia sp.]|nr:helix-turn-helix transcriptional regulator [Kaistia sp.]